MEYKNSMEFSEIESRPFSEFPDTHLEDLDKASLEKLSLQEASERIGENCYSNFVEINQGVLQAFREVSDNVGKDVFAKFYSEYVNHPEQMKEDNPDVYDFMRKWVFYGTEYDNHDLSFTGASNAGRMEHIHGTGKEGGEDSSKMQAHQGLDCAFHNLSKKDKP